MQKQSMGLGAAQRNEPLACPRCDSTATKFCYYNNYNLSQPRYLCKSCRRYWTHGGTLRNVPVGGATRKTKISKKPRTTSTCTTTSSSSSLPLPLPLPSTTSIAHTSLSEAEAESSFGLTSSEFSYGFTECDPAHLLGPFSGSDYNAWDDHLT